MDIYVILGVGHAVCKAVAGTPTYLHQGLPAAFGYVAPNIPSVLCYVFHDNILL